MKLIKLIEKYCKKCNKYVDIATTNEKEDFERCLTCHTILTYKKAFYRREEIKKSQAITKGLGTLH